MIPWTRLDIIVQLMNVSIVVSSCSITCPAPLLFILFSLLQSGPCTESNDGYFQCWILGSGFYFNNFENVLPQAEEYLHTLDFKESHLPATMSPLWVHATALSKDPEEYFFCRMPFRWAATIVFGLPFLCIVCACGCLSIDVFDHHVNPPNQGITPPDANGSLKPDTSGTAFEGSTGVLVDEA